MTMTETRQPKSVFFHIALVLLLLMYVLSINTDLAQYSQRLDTSVPNWFFRLIFILDFLVVFSLLLIYFYRKIGVIFFPLALSLHYIVYSFYLSTNLMSDLHVLFFYIGMGLFVIIPRWKSFK